MIGTAFEFALRHHAGQCDKSGMPYIGHVARVCAGVEGDDERVVALLHDTVEDTDATIEDISGVFGAQIAEAVDAITHRRGETQAAYLARVKANPTALAVKCADIADNSAPVRLQLLDNETAERLRVKYATARQLLEVA